MNPRGAGAGCPRWLGVGGSARRVANVVVCLYGASVVRTDRPGWVENRGQPMNCRRSARVIGVLFVVGALLGGEPAFGSSGGEPGARTSKGTLPAQSLAKVRQTVRQFKDRTRTPGVLVGIWSPKGTFVSATGVADVKTGRRLTTRMQFKIASQTKAFTGDLILQLVGEGKVSLDDHISKWVAGVPNGEQITIRQLLNMTAVSARAFWPTRPSKTGWSPGAPRRTYWRQGRRSPHSRPPAPRGPTATTATTCWDGSES